MIEDLDLPKLRARYILYIITIIFGLILLFSSFYTINAGERGVLLTFGKPNQISMGEGLHFKIPIAQTIKKMDVKTTKLEEGSDSASKDLQDVQTTIALNYHLSPEQVPKLYQEIGVAYQDRIIRPAIQETVKAISARFTAEELITKRAEVRNLMQNQLKERLAKSYIMVDDMNIVNFQFSEEFDAAIEKKVTAEQNALKAQRDLERIKIEKEQKITQAEAEAESLRLQKQEITPDLIRLREIEAQIKAIEKWNGVMSTTYVAGGSSTLLNLNPISIPK